MLLECIRRGRFPVDQDCSRTWRSTRNPSRAPRDHVFHSWRHNPPPIIVPNNSSRQKGKYRTKRCAGIYSIQRGGRAVNISLRIRNACLTNIRSVLPRTFTQRRPTSVFGCWVFPMPRLVVFGACRARTCHVYYATGHPCGESCVPSSPGSCVRTVVRGTSLSVVVAKFNGGA